MKEDQLEFIETHKADWQQKGFDYQYAIFVYLLMKGQLKDRVIYEEADDIVINYQNGKTRLIQVKHSIKDSSLTNSSDDVWKTLDNWYEWIFSHNAGGKNINDLELELITNKKNFNDLLLAIQKVQSGDANSDFLRKVLNDLLEKKSSKPFCEKLLSDETRILPFLMKIKFVYLLDPYAEAYQELLKRSPKGYSIDNAFDEIVGRMAKKKLSSDNNSHLSMTVEEFNFLCEDIFQGLVMQPFKAIEKEDKDIPKDYLSTNMVKQLLSIKLFSADDINNVELLTAYHNLWSYENSMDFWYVQNHCLTDKSIRDLNQKFKREWSLTLSRNFRKCDNTESSIVDCGYNCYLDTMDKEIELNGILIPKPFSSGWYLNLSNEHKPSVYWRRDWKSLNSDE